MFSALELKIIGALGLIVALAGAMAWAAHHEREIGASAITAAVADQHARDVEAARAREAQINTKQEASDREADKFNLQASTAAPRARDAGVRLQQRFDAINAGCVSDHPTAAAGSPPASSPADLRADVLGRLREAAGQFAAAADSARGAGLKSEGRYDALMP